MIVPAHVNLKYWFYPTGNTPAVNLFRQLPALDASHPTEEVEVLLLACGDPRSLLFSLWCVDGHSACRQYHFTCCDFEPAILARNSILLALIIDEGGDRTSQASWDLFYHLYVPQSSLSVLQTEVAKLLSVSESPEAWNSSPYGRFLRFLSWDTLREVRQIWLRYAQTWHFTAEELQQYETRARAGMEDNFKKYENTRVLHGVRSAGAMWSQAAATMSHAFARYWASGVVAGNAADVRRLGQQGRVNPMFATSSAPDGGFAVHYGTEPLLGFNLAEAFESVGNGNNNTVNHEALDRSVRLAKTQIQAWSTSLAHFVRADRIRIRLFCGDAVRLCQELERPPPAEKGTTFPSAYTKQWSFRPLVLDGEAWPHSQSQDEHPRFDVVDTSNLIDHVGAMTVLASAAPLLSRKPTSVLYTESLLLASEDVTSTLPQLLSSDTTTFSLAMGLTPIGHVIGYTTDEVGNEGFMSAIAPKAGRGQYRIRVSWGFPGLGDLSTPPPDPQCAMAPVEFDPDQLAAYFFDIYKKMFDCEDLSSLPSRTLRQFLMPLAIDLGHNTRAVLAFVLRRIRDHVATDWPRTMARFLDHVADDPKRLLGRNSLQELQMHLRLMGVPSAAVLDQDPRKIGMTPYGQPRPPAPGGKGVLAEAHLPAVIQILLIVPREKLQVFWSPECEGTPGLHLSVMQVTPGSVFENSFHAIHCAFGSVARRSDDGESCEIEEDADGWLGSSDLLVTCQVPTFPLLLGPRRGLRVTLAVNSTPSTTSLTSQLGFDLAIFQCGLDDRRLLILKDFPSLRVNARLLAEPVAWRSASGDRSATRVVVSLDGDFRVQHLTIRADTSSSPPESEALLQGASVTLAQSSPCTLLLGIGDNTRLLICPFPVDGQSPKIRVARRRSWVEVIVPVSRARDPAGFALSPFPVILPVPVSPMSAATPISWAMPRVELSKLPNALSQAGSNVSWLRPVMNVTLTDAERATNEQGSLGRRVDGWLDLKESLAAIFLAFGGVAKPGQGAHHTFCLVTRHDNECDILLFATSIFHELDSASVVMDACVVPLTLARKHYLAPALQRLHVAKPLSIAISAEESILWKQMLPALAERCRTWTHRPGCAYRTQGAPLSTRPNENPLCACGEGDVPPPFYDRPERAPFASSATRIAISPLFPVPYEESFMSLLEDRVQSTSAALATTSIGGTVNARRCDSCQVVKDGLKPCARCRKVCYCNRNCQRAAWKEHKRNCRES